MISLFISQVKFTVRNMTYRRELGDFHSRHFDEMKRMFERELFAVLRANASFVMGVKLMRFENMTGFVEANFIVITNETARFRNNTMFDLRNAIANGTFMSLVVDQQYPVHVQCKCAFVIIYVNLVLFSTPSKLVFRFGVCRYLS